MNIYHSLTEMAFSSDDTISRNLLSSLCASERVLIMISSGITGSFAAVPGKDGLGETFDAGIITRSAYEEN